jgi:hypothetical protein
MAFEKYRRWIHSGLTRFSVRMGEGSSGDSKIISSKKNSGESPLLPSPYLLKIHCHTEFFHKKNLNYLTEILFVEE